MSKKDDDASNWTIGDMRDNEAGLNATSKPSETVWVTERFEEVPSEEEAKRLRRYLGPRAKREGKVIEIEKQRNGTWKVSVQHKETRKKK